MLVPLDLAALAWKQSHLSPELALGWRLGRHAHDCFDGLEQVRIAAAGHVHTLAALRRMARFPEPGQVLQPSGPRPWDILFYHQPTATALKVVLVRHRITLPRAIRSLEGAMENGGGDDIARRYQEGLDILVERIVNGDIHRLCFICRIHCRVLAPPASSIPGCPWCRAHHPELLLDVDGRVCCPVCSGLEPSWLQGPGGEN